MVPPTILTSSRLRSLTLTLALACCGGCDGDPLPPDDAVTTPADLAQDGAAPDLAGDSVVLPDTAGLDAATPDAATPPPLTDNTLPPKHWHWQGSLAADRGTLGAAFAKAGYWVPAGCYLLAAQIIGGLNQPGFRYFSLGDSGLTYSAGKYWPASTVKLTAAVGALWTLSSYGLSGKAVLSFTDDDGAFAGPVSGLFDQAIVVSSNVAYNRLMEIAGFDLLNDSYLVPAQGLPLMVLQRRYTHPQPGSNLRTSPAMTYVEGAKQGTIPKRVGQGLHPACPNEGNCTTLFELLDVLRRLVLHTQLPPSARFPLQTDDVNGLRVALLKSPTWLQPGAGQALGTTHALEVYNKRGQVPSDDRLDHGMIVDKTTGARYLVAWSMPYASTSEAQGSELTRRALLALQGASSSAPPLQLDAGPQITIQLTDKGPGAQPKTRRYHIAINAPGADRLQLWVDRYALPAPQGPNPYFTLTYDFSAGGERLLVVRAHSKTQLLAHRAVRIQLTAP